jgi:hypothetical protein
MTDTPEDWVLIEAAKRCDIHGANLSGLRSRYQANSDPFRALCDMIAKHEQQPVDRKMLCAREAEREMWRKGEGNVFLGVRAIELWIKGYGE